jgi:hypothetical protein
MHQYFIGPERAIGCGELTKRMLSARSLREHHFLLSALPTTCLTFKIKVSGWMSIYRNKPLRRGQIRTITLHSGTNSDSVNCTLDVVYLKDRTPYKALSYTWGPPGETKEITIDGSVVLVRENLYQALYHLRYPTTARRLWVDAVCIDQSNVDERNWQVSQMSRIYAAANEVLIWLGKETMDGFGMPTVKTEFEEAPWWEPVNPSENWTAFQEHVKKRMKLYDNEYFTRIWIVQEIMFAARITVHFGPHLATWREFTACFGKADNHRAKTAISLVDLKNNRSGNDGVIRHSLAKWLENFQNSQCQDPRDKVYAFLGLISPISRRMIKVDYKMSVSDVFWEARRAEQFAHPLNPRWKLDHHLSRAFQLQYLLRPRLPVALTSKRFNLHYIPVYKRPGLTGQEGTNTVLGFGVDDDLESLFENDNIRIISYSHRRIRL